MKRLPGMMYAYSLAEALHMDVDSILSMPSKRLTYWQAYFNIKDMEHKKAMAESEMKSRARGKRR